MPDTMTQGAERLRAGAPLLVLEVLSPSSHRRDPGDKLTAYSDASVPSYRVVDPVHPRLRAWALRDGEYVEVADVSDDDTWTAEATTLQATARRHRR